jgi:superfamily I DNA and/or RNA helicase
MVDENKFLILIYKNGEWMDKTRNISWIAPNANSVALHFKGSSTLYHYSWSEIRIDGNANPLDENVLFVRGEKITGFQKVIFFSNTQKIKVFFPNRTRFFDKNECEFIRDMSKSPESVKNTLRYFKIVAENEATRDPEKNSYLQKEYEDIFSTTSDTALNAYLTRTNHKYFAPELYFPFDFNGSQYQAVKKAFENQISIIEGPPGTGKTQTILNILATAILNHKTIAVASSNNSAIANVKEKLESSGYGSIVAMLGNNDNVNAFFSEAGGFSLPADNGSEISFSQYCVALKDKVNLDNLRIEKSKLEEQLKGLVQEANRFTQDPSLQPPKNLRLFPRITSREALEARVFLEEKEKMSFFQRLFFSHRYHISIQSLRNLPISDLILTLQFRYYESKDTELKESIRKLKEKIQPIESGECDKIIHTYSSACFIRCLRKNCLAEKSSFSAQNYKDYFEEFLARHPVLLASTFSLKKCTKPSFTYDFLIIDESSQVNLLSAIPALSVAKNVVILGDLKQLTEIDDVVTKKNAKDLENTYQIPPCFSAINNNLLSSVKDAFSSAVPSTLLNEHYRCQSDIIGFSNRRFYDDRLVCFTKPDGESSHLRLIKTVPGRHARRNSVGTGLYNEREIEEVLRIIQGIPSNQDIAVITPYRRQADLLAEKVPKNVHADTVHKFQGRESDVVIFSTVANSSDDYIKENKTIPNFANQENLINVAMTRAKHAFILVTSDEIYKNSKGCLGDLVRYLRFTAEIKTEEGQVKSIFDILYDGYDEVREAFLRKHPSKDVITENLMLNHLKTFIGKDPYASLAIRQHVSLRDLIKIRKDDFTPDELHYLQNPLTHVDFTIFNVYDKKPVLFIEVDGIRYHEQNEKQALHDTIKNKAIQLSGIPFLRLKTNGDSEKEKIEEALA